MTSTSARLIPTLRYRDPAAAVNWLCAAFGFTRHFVAEEEGRVVHAQLRRGSREFSCRDPEGHIWTMGTYFGEPSPA